MAHRALVALLALGAISGVGQTRPVIEPDDAMTERIPFTVPPAPGAEELSRLIATTRGIALNYTASMPNFVCTERVTRFVSPPGAPRWIPNDNQTIEVSYSTKKGESYKLIAINDKPTTKKLEKTSGFHSRGEFGSLLGATFHPAAQTHFFWERWTTVHNRSAYVLSYKVDLPNSSYSVDLRDGKKRYAGITAVKGLVYIDRETNQVMRLTAEADDLPASWPRLRTTTVLDYDFVEIGGQRYLLPTTVDSKVLLPGENSRNRVEFRDYRKFGAEVTLTFEK